MKRRGKASPQGRNLQWELLVSLLLIPTSTDQERCRTHSQHTGSLERGENTMGASANSVGSVDISAVCVSVSELN